LIEKITVLKCKELLRIAVLIRENHLALEAKDLGFLILNALVDSTIDVKKTEFSQCFFAVTFSLLRRDLLPLFEPFYSTAL